MLLGGSAPPPSMTDLVLGGSDPPPSMTDLVLGGSDPPPSMTDLALGGEVRAKFFYAPRFGAAKYLDRMTIATLLGAIEIQLQISPARFIDGHGAERAMHQGIAESWPHSSTQHCVQASARKKRRATTNPHACPHHHGTR